MRQPFRAIQSLFWLMYFAFEPHRNTIELPSGSEVTYKLVATLVRSCHEPVSGVRFVGHFDHVYLCLHKLPARTSNTDVGHSGTKFSMFFASVHGLAENGRNIIRLNHLARHDCVSSHLTFFCLDQTKTLFPLFSCFYRIFGGSNDYSILHYRRNNEGQLYGFESSVSYGSYEFCVSTDSLIPHNGWYIGSI